MGLARLADSHFLGHCLHIHSTCGNARQERRAATTTRTATSLPLKNATWSVGALAGIALHTEGKYAPHATGLDLGCIHDWHGGSAGSMHVCIGTMDDVQAVHGALLDQRSVA